MRDSVSKRVSEFLYPRQHLLAPNFDIFKLSYPRLTDARTQLSCAATDSEYAAERFLGGKMDV